MSTRGPLLGRGHENGATATPLGVSSCCSQGSKRGGWE